MNEQNRSVSYVQFIANIENHIESNSVPMDSQGSSRRSSACSVPDVDTCGLEEEQVWGLGATMNTVIAYLYFDNKY